MWGGIFMIGFALIPLLYIAFVIVFTVMVVYALHLAIIALKIYIRNNS